MPALSLEVMQGFTTVIVSMTYVFDRGPYLSLWAKVSVPSGTHLAQPIVRAISCLWIPSGLIMNEPVKALKLSPSKKVISVKL
jgi:hypothetical protein